MSRMSPDRSVITFATVCRFFILFSALLLLSGNAASDLPNPTPGESSIAGETKGKFAEDTVRMLRLPTDRLVMLMAATEMRYPSRTIFSIEFETGESDLSSLVAMQDIADVWGYVRTRASESQATRVEMTVYGPAITRDGEVEGSCWSCMGDNFGVKTCTRCNHAPYTGSSRSVRHYCRSRIIGEQWEPWEMDVKCMADFDP